MYLYVEIVDTWSAWHEAQMGFATTSNRRIKKIKLTNEQIEELRPKKIGKDIFEKVSVLCIQED